MKLFVYDQKHEQVLNEMEIKDQDEVRRVVNFLDRIGMTNRYNTLVIAKDYRISYNKDEPEVEFIYQ